MFYRLRNVKFKVNIPNGWGAMPSGPVPADPGWDDDPARYAAEPEGPWWEEEDYPDPADELTAEELAEFRGDGGPGGAAAAFGAGAALDVMPGCPELALFADAAAGADDGYAGAI